MTVAVVVPLRTDDPDRLAAAEWLHGWYRRHFPDWRWVPADCEGEWNKPAALNHTIARVDCDTLVVTDADLFIDPQRLSGAAETLPWCVPQDRVHRLSRDATAAVYAGSAPDPSDVIKRPYRAVAGGGLFTMPRQTWDDIGGMDPQFVGWGEEDKAFAVAADTIAGPHVRLPGPLWHLYHDPGPRKRHPSFAANKARLGLYRQAAGDPEQIRRLRNG